MRVAGQVQLRGPAVPRAAPASPAANQPRQLPCRDAPPRQGVSSPTGTCPALIVRILLRISGSQGIDIE